MLNQAICKRCRLRHGLEWDDLSFSVTDSECWEIGIVFCPMSPDSLYLKARISELPSGCSYKLEHAVAAGMTHA